MALVGSTDAIVGRVVRGNRLERFRHLLDWSSIATGTLCTTCQEIET